MTSVMRMGIESESIGNKMNIPFSYEQFLNVFENYNVSVWPFQIVLVILAIAAIILSFKNTRFSDKTIAYILSFFWLWIGVVYHLIFFTVINPAAYFFGILFVVQGCLFFMAGLKKQITFTFNRNIYTITGILFFIYAIIIYPILSHTFGHIYPKAPTFGLPCPTVIFTFGVLLFSKKKIPLFVVIIPFIWSIIGFSAAINLQIYEDFGLAIAGILGTLFIFIKNKKTAAHKS